MKFLVATPRQYARQRLFCALHFISKVWWPSDSDSGQFLNLLETNFI